MFKNYLLFLAVVSILLETLAAKSSVFNDLDFDPIISVVNAFKNKTNSLKQINKSDAECRLVLKYNHLASLNSTREKLLNLVDKLDVFTINKQTCFFIPDPAVEYYADMIKKCAEYKFASPVYFKSQAEFSYFKEFSRAIIQRNPRARDFHLGLRFHDFAWRWEYQLNESNISIEYLNELLQTRLPLDGSESPTAVLRFVNESNLLIKTYDDIAANYVCRLEMNNCHMKPCKNGMCVFNPVNNTYSCLCRLFYEGKHCDQYSSQGKQTILVFILILFIFLALLAFKLFRELINKFFNQEKSTRVVYERVSGFKVNTKKLLLITLVQKKKKATLIVVIALLLAITFVLFLSSKFNADFNIKKYILDFQATSYGRVLCKIKHGTHQDFVLLYISLILSVVLYMLNAAKSKSVHDKKNCTYYKKYQNAIEQQHFSLSRFTLQRMAFYICFCSCGFTLPVPMNPFCKNNRFITCTIFAAYFFNIMKIFRTSLFDLGNFDDQVKLYDKLVNKSLSRINSTVVVNSSDINMDDLMDLSFTDSMVKMQTSFLSAGILYNLIAKVMYVFVYGFHFYPILVCVDLKLKGTIAHGLCMIYAWLMLFYYILAETLCSGQDLQPGFIDLIKHLIKKLFNKDAFPDLKRTSIKDRVNNLTSNMELNQMKFERIEESLSENFAFYVVLSVIAIYLTVEFVALASKDIIHLFRVQRLTWFSVSESQDPGREYALEMNLKNEFNYTKRSLDRSHGRRCVSFVKYQFERYVYRSEPYYRFSKQFISTQVILFMILYYMTSVILKYTDLVLEIIYGSVAMLLEFLVKDLIKKVLMKKYMSNRAEINEDEELLMSQPEQPFVKLANKTDDFMLIMDSYAQDFFNYVDGIIETACICTTLIYALQILIFIREYRKHVVNAYRGIYTQIPPPSSFSNVRIVSGSIRFSGYSIGYLLWGYSLLFNFMIVCTLILRLVFSHPLIYESILQIVLPVITIFLFKKLIVWLVSYHCLVVSSRSDRRLELRNKKLHLLLNHFNFFFDCLTISFVCLVRVLTAVVLSLFYMSRLDCSIYGRHMERNDMGYISFLTFLHMEVNQTHPIKLVFCELLLSSKKDPNNNNSNSNARKRWHLAYTLIFNPHLKKARKHYNSVNVTRVERFDQFIRRHLYFMFPGLSSNQQSFELDEIKNVK